MTEQKHLKALIRARMARTGESYTAARAHIVSTEVVPSLIPRAEFRAHDKHCMTAVFTPDDANIVSGGFGGQARIWSPDGQLVGELVGHSASVNVVCLSADGSTAVTAASDKTVRVWDLPRRAERALLGKHKKQVLALALDMPRARVWSGGHDGRLQAWDLQRLGLVETHELGGSVTSIALRPDDGLLAVGTVGAGISVRDSSGREVRRLAPDLDVVNTVAWSGDGASLVASAQGSATVWAAEGWDHVRSLATGEGGMLPVALSPDGRRLALGWDNHLALWSADEDQPAVTIAGLPKGVYGLAFSHDGKLLAMAAADGRVRTWDVT